MSYGWKVLAGKRGGLGTGGRAVAVEREAAMGLGAVGEPWPALRPASCSHVEQLTLRARTADGDPQGQFRTMKNKGGH